MATRNSLDHYVEVSERIRAFYEKYPRGSIQTELVRLEDGMVIFKAMVYRDPDDPHPVTGWAYEREGSSPVNRTWFVENCETSAIGRALANLNLAGGPRPSREEMAKVERMREEEWRQRATPEQRIRRLLRELRLDPAKRARIEAKLAAGMDEREANELEAYLLALRTRAS